METALERRSSELRRKECPWLETQPPRTDFPKSHPSSCGRGFWVLLVGLPARHHDIVMKLSSSLQVTHSCGDRLCIPKKCAWKSERQRNKPLPHLTPITPWILSLNVSESSAERVSSRKASSSCLLMPYIPFPTQPYHFLLSAGFKGVCVCLPSTVCHHCLALCLS